MRPDRSGFRVVMLVCAGAVMFACAAPDPPPPDAQAPEVTFVSVAEAAEIWEAAESREPVGEALVETFDDDHGTTVVCRQAFRLSFPGGRGPMTSLSCCTGRCVLTEGSTLGDCQTSGCSSSGSTCSQLSCSGGCKLETACAPCSGGTILAQM